MPNSSQTSDFWGWYTRHNNRTVWKNFSDAGMDVFADGPNQNPQAFLQLNNILPAINGSLNKRWGVGLYTEDSPSAAQTIVRTFLYNTPQDNSDPSNTADTNLWLGTDNSQFYIYNDSGSPYTGFGPTAFTPAAGQQMTALSSRRYFYYSDGLLSPRKCNPSYTTAATDSLMGIALTSVSPANSYQEFPSVLFSGPVGTPFSIGTSGKGYTTPPTVTITDSAGVGSGASITTTIDSQGRVDGFSIVHPGSNYAIASATLSAPPAGGVQANLVLYTEGNSNRTDLGTVQGADLAGPMSFASGRQWAVALQNSLTGHTSDVYVNNAALGYKSGTFLDALTSTTSSNVTAVNTFPVYLSSSNVSAGYTEFEFLVSIPNAASLDPQVDTVILMASPDGQELSTLYEVARLPLSTFSLVSGSLQRTYVDTLPDSYSEFYIDGPTLLASNVWAETDSLGNATGIFENTPPPAGLKYFTLHQGRMFATDGKTLFFSKSAAEVVTSTGLITSKWEECWPGDYQLALALSNEEIRGIRSDGTTLHVGTDRSIFAVYGSDPDNFSVPATTFQETGILHNDLWTVVYSEGQPSGFAWMTPDYKLMYSDFSTYREIGTPLYPLFQQLSPTFIEQMKITSLTQGPYNLVFVHLLTPGPGGFGFPVSLFYVWDSRLDKWFQWFPPEVDTSTNKIYSSFVYQFPTYTSSTKNPGSRYLFYWTQTRTGFGTNNFQLHYFNPATSFDIPSVTPIDWAVQTSWQDLSDSTAIKCVNEIELTSDDAPITCTLYGATSQGQFGSPRVLKTGNTVTGPIASLQSNKFYTAGVDTTAKYYSLLFTPAAPTTSPDALSSFSLETYPVARI